MLKTTYIDFLKTKDEVFYNAKTKMYPDGTDETKICNRRIYKDPAYESRDYSHRNRPTSYNTNGESRTNNANAVRVKVFDMARINNFKYFVTLTFDPKKVESRYDDKEIKKILKIWLKNAVARKDLIYLLIPERHKDGAIHCHALMSGNLSFVDSGLVNDYGKPIYNIADWKYGFSTAFEIVDDNGQQAFIKYVSKYITKDCKKIFGNYYLAGGKGLKRDVPFRLANIDYLSVDADEYIVFLGGKPSNEEVTDNLNNTAYVPDLCLKFKEIIEESRLINLCHKLQTTV